VDTPQVRAALHNTIIGEANAVGRRPGLAVLSQEMEPQPAVSRYKAIAY